MLRFLLCWLVASCLLTGTRAQTVTLTGPAGSRQFGDGITVLTNGNYVVRDAYCDNGPNIRAGAIYLYDGRTHTLISRLTGSAAQDQIGSSGVVALKNGNFVVISPAWDNGPVIDAGAVTWVNGTTGLSGTVSSANSLVGSTANDFVGSPGVTPLANGNYVVRSSGWNGASTDLGAVTWGNGTTGISGPVSSTNSITGSTASDQVGRDGTVELSNGNYVVMSRVWSGTALSAGAVTWGSGTAPITGIVSSANSLIGSAVNDQVGSAGIAALSNGNYVVGSPGWNGVGAATWGNGTTGISGTISSSNSLTGSKPLDRVGMELVALTNGNYVVGSQYWDGLAVNSGAATWGNGSTGITGIVSSSNSLIGSSTGDFVGTSIMALTNGNYVVASPSWNGSATGAGAVTWGNGTTGITGAVTSGNSLIGGTAGDQVGTPGVFALTNGNYVVGSQYWDGTAANTGAATWANGTTGISGTISSANSLVGSSDNDQIGSNGITVLTNGNYVVSSPAWDGAAENTGAVTWGSGTTGITGVVSSANSLTGSAMNDQVGYNGATALSNGNYVVGSSIWNSTTSFVGAATWADGTKGISGVVSSANSLTGTVANEYVGNYGIMALDNGNYIVRSCFWKGTANSAGAVTWADGTRGMTGAINSANSLVGSSAYDLVGYLYAYTYPNGYYVLKNQNWDGPTTNCGAYSIGGPTALTGFVNPCNSVIGTATDAVNTSQPTFNSTHEYFMAGMYKENKVVIFTPGTQALAMASATATQTISVPGRVHFIADTCDMVLTLRQSGMTPVSGPVTSKVFVKSTAPSAAGVAFVRRHYDIQPAANPGTRTGTVRLYFTREDFTDYNAANGSGADLPTGPSDVAGIGALRISQQHGSSSSGAPGTYSGTETIINPADSNVVWNSSVSRWEVTFDVTGFGGFFAFAAKSTGTGSLNSGRSDLQVAPVPAMDHIVVSTKSGPASATLSDIYGRVQLRFEVRDGARVDISMLPAGIYILRSDSGEMIRLVKR